MTQTSNNKGSLISIKKLPKKRVEFKNKFDSLENLEILFR